MEKYIFQSRLDESRDLLRTIEIDIAIEFAKMVWNLRQTNNKVIFIGNGASNTIANHAALDFMNQTGIKTISFSDPAVLTAFSNDFGYDISFERFVKIYYDSGDILVCISSSGMSDNIINAARYITNIKGVVIAFTGFEKDNKLGQLVSRNFWVASSNYNVVEGIHNIWLAIISDILASWVKK